MMSRFLFSGVSSLAATTEKLETKTQGTSGCGSYWPGIGLHSHLWDGSETNCGTSWYFEPITQWRIPSVGSQGWARETRKATPSPHQTGKTNINAFYITESPSVASDTKACCHTPVDQDMEIVTHECKTAKRLIESNRFQ